MKDNVVSFDQSKVTEVETETPDELNSPEAIALRKELIENMEKAEQVVRQTLGDCNVLAGIHVEKNEKGLRYVGEITMIGQDDEVYGQNVEGPYIEKRIPWGKVNVQDTRRELAAILREIANCIYDNIQEHP